ncbi:MAG: PAS domain S-box protein [Planctomycetes bacterium]|nr:PAS domain S-box protein [Planctomycetota bacterium]
MAPYADEQRTADLHDLYEQIMNYVDPLMGIIGGGAAVIDTDLRIVNYGSTHEKWFGPIEQNRGRPCYIVFCGVGKPCPDCPIQQLVADPDMPAATRERDIVTKDGTHRPVRMAFLPVKDPDGNVPCVMEVAEDKTAERNTEAKLAERNRLLTERETRRLASLTQTVTDAIILVGTDLKITVWNPGAERIFGYTADEATGRQINMIHTSEEDVAEIHKALLEKGEFISEKTCRKKNGAPIDIAISVSCQADDDGNIEGFLGFVKDITELRQTQQQLFQAQKMESIGTLAGGIAHDFNNILSSILGHASFLKEAITPDSELYTDIERIESAALTGAGLTRQLLGFARGGKYQPRPMCLNDVVSDTIEMLSRTVGKNIVLRKSLHPDLWTVEADRTQMQQVLMNLCINSRDAMLEGGTLLIETGNVELSQEDIMTTYGSARPGRHVRLSVNDTGAGMDEETRRRAFEPFFSRNERGSGLGLATVYGIVRNHGGFTTLYSEPGKGTTVRVYLPVIETVAEEKNRPALEVLTGTETILIIDDEPSVQQVLARMLERMGYPVLVAASGGEGLAAYAANKDKIDLILLDMLLPDMPGEEVFDRLKETSPDVRVLLSSGFSETEPAIGAQKRGALGFLEKPYTISELSIAIRRALGKESEAPVDEDHRATDRECVGH